MVNLHREVARIVVAQVENNLLAGLERLLIQSLNSLVGTLHTPTLKGLFIGNASYDALGFYNGLLQLGFGLLGLAQPRFALRSKSNLLRRYVCCKQKGKK